MFQSQSLLKWLMPCLIGSLLAGRSFKRPVSRNYNNRIRTVRSRGEHETINEGDIVAPSPSLIVFPSKETSLPRPLYVTSLPFSASKVLSSSFSQNTSLVSFQAGVPTQFFLELSTSSSTQLCTLQPKHAIYSLLEQSISVLKCGL